MSDLAFPPHVSMAVPAGQSQEGLPIGVQVSVRRSEEELVLEVASAVEQACVIASIYTVRVETY
jgi:Asp-tRNA(Asn)/Glu-tRNA(Gln) amidotransferase A subunit family amidase